MLLYTAIYTSTLRNFQSSSHIPKICSDFEMTHRTRPVTSRYGNLAAIWCRLLLDCLTASTQHANSPAPAWRWTAKPLHAYQTAPGAIITKPSPALPLLTSLDLSSKTINKLLHSS